MNERKSVAITFGFVVAVSLISSVITVLLISHYYSRQQFDLLNAVCGEV